MGRTQPRVVHGGVAHVIAPGASWTGETANLSVGGAFITGGPELDVGRRVTVAIELGDGEPAVEAHARVAWRRPIGEALQPAGLGVRFVRLDDQAARRIHQLVDARGRAPVEVLHGPVRVQLPGLETRLRADARELTSGTLVVEAELSWLKIGAPISTEVAPGDVRDGRLAWIGVEVAPSGHARLCLHVELDESSRTEIEVLAGPQPDDLDGEDADDEPTGEHAAH